MNNTKQGQIYDSSEQTDHKPPQKVKNEACIQYSDISQNTIQQLIELIRRTFKEPPKLIIEAAYKSLGLHKKESTPTQDFPNPSAYSNANQYKYPQTAGFSQVSDNGPRKRGRPRKTYEDQKRDEIRKNEAISQYQLYSNSVEQSKQDKQRQFAQIFIMEGYGITIAKKRLKFQFEINFYYNSMRTIMFRSFKKLEEKVRTECKQPVDVSEEHKSMKFKTELCSFERWLHPDLAQTFRQYIKSVYDLQPQPVSKSKTVNLYRSILVRWAKMKKFDGRYKGSNMPIDSQNPEIQQ